MQGLLMEQHEREYFISRVRCGYYRIKSDGLVIKVMPPHLEDLFLSQEHYQNVYDDAVSQGVMTESESLEWMIENNLWDSTKDDKIKAIEKDIEKLQVKIYQYRFQPRMVYEGKKLLRQAERALKDINKEKQLYYNNTCEGIASQEKAVFLFQKSCQTDDKAFDFGDSVSNNLFYLWACQILSESQIRELARNEPWRSSWSVRESSDLFIDYKDRDLTVDQKNLITWSRMFDNINESMDCPTDDVLEDDDMLNGWLVIQRQESEKAKQEKTADTMLSDKVANSQEILLMAHSKEEASMINDFNSPHAKRVQKDRLSTVKQKGTATDLDFKDKRMEINRQSNEQYKRKFR